VGFLQRHVAGTDRAAIARRYFLAAPNAREAEMARRRSDTPPEIRAPLAVLGLSWPITMLVLRNRYKDLAKQHHPDANLGDKASEERIKGINIAYSAVRVRLLAEPKLAKTG